MNYKCLLRRGILILLLAGTGCVRNFIYLPGATKRAISQAQVLSPERTRFTTSNIKESDATDVCESDLIGKWRLDGYGEDRVIDHIGMTESKKVVSFREVFEFESGGRVLGVFNDGTRGEGTWSLSGGVLSIDFRGLGASFRLLRWRVRKFGEDIIEERYPDVDAAVRSTGKEIAGYRKMQPRGGYDGEGAWRVSWAYVDCKNGKNVFTQISEIAPRLLHRVAGGNPAAQALANERKKNLDSLLKAGVITEEEYKRELGKGTK